MLFKHEIDLNFSQVNLCKTESLQSESDNWKLWDLMRKEGLENVTLTWHRKQEGVVSELSDDHM